MDRKEQIEPALIRQLQEGNKIAFKAIFDQYSLKLFQFSLKYLRNREEAEDVVHDVFLTIWEKRHSITSDLSFQSYLFTIAYNQIKKHFLNKSREEKYKQVFAEDYLFTSTNDEENIDFLSLVKKVDEIIELLPERRKEIFILSRKEGLKNAEVAEHLGLTVQFVKNQISIAKKFIKEEACKNNHLLSLLFYFLFVK